MIDAEHLFNELGGRRGVWCGGVPENSELASVAAAAIDGGAACISAAPDDVGPLWIWLEHAPIKIYGRFYLPSGAGGDVDIVSDLAGRINQTFKRGAHGAQIFVGRRDLAAFADAMHTVRDDLFFNKDLSVGLDIGDVDAVQWGAVWDALRRVRASSLVLALTRDAGVKSDFVGRVFGALCAWNPAFSGDLHFAVGARRDRAEQAVRLVQSVRPELVDGMRVFVS